MNKNTTYWGETTRGKTPDLSFVSQRLPESGHLLSLFHLSIPMWRQRRTIWLDPMAQRPRPGRAGLWASLTPLEASKLVHGPLRVDPGGDPDKKNPEPKNFCCFPSEFDQLIGVQLSYPITLAFACVYFGSHITTDYIMYMLHMVCFTLSLFHRVG